MSVFEKLGIVFSVFILIVLGLLIIFGKHGLMDFRQLKAKEDKIILETQQIESENRKIAKEIHALKNDLDYIEHVARHEHEMADPGDLIFKIKKDKVENESQGEN